LKGNTKSNAIIIFTLKIISIAYLRALGKSEILAFLYLVFSTYWLLLQINASA